MVKLTIVQRNEEYQARAQITAERADWEPRANGGQWKLSGALMMTGLEPGGTPKVNANYNEPYKGSITPEEIALYRSRDYVNLLSTERINQLLNRRLSYGANQLLRVKHTRFTQPLINIILLLLAIPCVLTREPGKLKRAAMKCLILTGACLAMVFVCSMLANQPPKPAWADEWPAIMAWTPILLFGPLAVWLLDRVET